MTSVNNPNLKESPSQTAGPYVHIGMLPVAAGNPARSQEIDHLLARNEGENTIKVVGRVVDGNGNLIKDAFIEVWQANEKGEYQSNYSLNNDFNSFGRTATDFGTGEWTITTVKPGSVETALGTMAPHIGLAIFARGINIQLHTRLYFADEAEKNAKCPIYTLIEHPARRETLLAHYDEDAKAYRFDVVVQGEGETVFFDF
ncbi:MAG: protocatechuate 3,4-dioxygenase subunit alpha [Pontibacterium sp.]